LACGGNHLEKRAIASNGGESDEDHARGDHAPGEKKSGQTDHYVSTMGVARRTLTARPRWKREEIMTILFDIMAEQQAPLKCRAHHDLSDNEVRAVARFEELRNIQQRFAV
jgi:hypothetical protein